LEIFFSFIRKSNAPRPLPPDAHCLLDHSINHLPTANHTCKSPNYPSLSPTSIAISKEIPTPQFSENPVDKLTIVDETRMSHLRSVIWLEKIKRFCRSSGVEGGGRTR